MLTVTDVELRVGARLLMDEVNFRVDKGDKVGLVGRNGAGKTTLTKVLAGGGQPTAGTVTRTGRIGYLPQDPKVEDMDQSGRDRILSARDLDQTIRRMREAEAGMAAVDDAERERAMNRYSRLEAEFEARGGYAAESEAARITSNLGLPDRVLDQPLHTLSGGQRRRVELARILFSDADIMLLDEPTNHLDHDSIVWLRDYLKTYSGGLLMISHDVELMEMTVNKVLYLDANRQTMDVYNMTWKNYLAQRQQDEARRRREFANAEKKASALMAQAEKMAAKKPSRYSPIRAKPRRLKMPSTASSGTTSPMSTVYTGIRAEHDMSGVTKMVMSRSLRFSMVRALIMAGTAQATPEIRGTMLLPFSPKRRMMRSIIKVTRAM